MKITGSKFKGLKLSKEIEKLQLKAWALKRQTQFRLSPFLIYCKEEMNWTAIAGTGKTAIFAIPVLESTDWENKTLQAVILCSTKELPVQVAGELKKFKVEKG